MAPCGPSKNYNVLVTKEMLVGAVGIEITLTSVLKDLQNILRNRKKQLSSLGNAYCCPKAASFFIPPFRAGNNISTTFPCASRIACGTACV